MDVQRRSKAHRRRIGAAFTPADIAGLSLWLRADSGTWQDNGMTTPAASDADPVGAWVDKSGNAFNFTSVQDADRPALKLSILNTQPVLRFNGSAHYLNREAVLGTSDSEGTLFIVTSTTDTGNVYVFCVSDDAGTSRRVLFGKPSNPDAIHITQRNSDTADQVDGDTSIHDGTARCWVWKSTGSAYVFYINGAAESLNVVSGSNSGDWMGDCSSLDNTTIGAWDYGSGRFGHWDGDVAEIIYYNTALSDANRQLVEQYLSTRYGLGF